MNIEEHAIMISDSLAILNAINMYRSGFHILEVWGLTPLSNGLRKTQKAKEDLQAGIDYLSSCEDKIKKAIIIRELGEEKDEE